MKRIIWGRVGTALALLPFAGFDAKAETPLVVAADGSGQFTYVQAALNAVPQNTGPANWCVILVKPDIYQELTYVQTVLARLPVVHFTSDSANRSPAAKP